MITLITLINHNIINPVKDKDPDKNLVTLLNHNIINPVKEKDLDKDLVNVYYFAKFTTLFTLLVITSSNGVVCLIFDGSNKHYNLFPFSSVYKERIPRQRSEGRKCYQR